MDIVSDYHQKVLDFLTESAEINGLPYIQELLYRFSVAQFRDTLGFKSPNFPVILKVFYELHAELGSIFEEFAEKAIDSGMDEALINDLLKEWFKEYWLKHIAS